MLPPANINRLIKEQIFFAYGSDLENIPEKPGIYAWFLPVNINFENLFQSVQEDTRSKAREMLQAELNKYNDVHKINGTLGPYSVAIGKRNAELGSDLRIFAEGKKMLEEDKKNLFNIFMALSIFNAPIYVGMTEREEGLKKRLREHIQAKIDEASPNANLRTRLFRATGDRDLLERCLAAAVPMAQLDNQIYRFAEHVLIQSIRPIQSKRG